ncbi:MAG TPA: glycosyltransferase [Leptolyngbyaceae cyanobacterium]
MTKQEIKVKNLLHGLELCAYISGSGEKYLQDRIIVDPMTAFEEDGSNLTITFLSLNRVHLSIRLINSIINYIPNFQGKILIVDNGSDTEQLKILKKYISNMNINLDIEIKELGINFGVAGGRNRSAEFIKTDWFMPLDNDVYFVKNPLPLIKNCVDQLGVHFINLPLLNKDALTIFTLGGNLLLVPHENSYYVGCPSSFKNVLYTEVFLDKPFLSTLLYGTSVIKTKSFIEQEGFDENMFIGFEDIDFSLRLYKKGIKIGNIASFCAIHGHEAPKNQADIDYERIRFSREKIKESAHYFFAKHNIHVWNNYVDEWLNNKEKDLQIQETEEFRGASESITSKVTDFDLMLSHQINNEKPKIALVIDREGWAFHNIAKQIVSNLSNKYDFTIFATNKYENIALLLLEIQSFDLAHFFWRDIIFGLLYEQTKLFFQHKGWDYKDFITNFFPKLNITTSVYDHLFLSAQQIKERDILFNGFIRGYTVCSQKLADIYSDIDNYSDPNLIIEDGVDLTQFFPANIERLFENDREIIVGWAGNSEWGPWQQDGIDYKGFRTLIKPAVEELRAEGYPVRGVYADRAVKWLPHDQMNDYYNSIDIYICASEIEGTPNPVLEAMACGLPVISTNVGVVSQVFGKLQSQFILPIRNLETLKDKLRLLLESPETRKSLSEENLASIQSWSWKDKCIKWDSFFEKMLSETEQELSRSDLLRKMILEKHINYSENIDIINRQRTLLLEQAEWDKKIMQTRIEAMESSKFWQLRKRWFQFKRKLGLTQEEP